MAVSRALRRLLRVLEIEEDQCRLALESGSGHLRHLERALEATVHQAQSGRRLVAASAHSGELPDRLSGIEESHSAQRRAKALVPRITDAKSEVEALRQTFLAKRVECRQVETLIADAEARDVVIAGRRSQQSLDAWYLNRMHAAKFATDPHNPSSRSSVPDTFDETIAETLSEI